MILNSSSSAIHTLSDHILAVYSDRAKGTVHLNGARPDESWELVNHMGTCVLEGVGTLLNLQSLPSGIYQLEIRNQLHRIVK